MSIPRSNLMYTLLTSKLKPIYLRNNNNTKPYTHSTLSFLCRKNNLLRNFRLVQLFVKKLECVSNNFEINKID